MVTDKTMKKIVDYFVNQAREQKKKDLQMEPIAKDLILMAMDLEKILPYDLEITFASHVYGLDIRFLEHNDGYDVVWDVSLYTKGNLVDLDKAKKVKKSLQEAIKFSRLPAAPPKSRWQ
jgi:hypothetical protein